MPVVPESDHILRVSLDYIMDSCLNNIKNYLIDKYKIIHLFKDFFSYLKINI